MKLPFCQTCPEPDCNPLGMWPGQPAWEGETTDPNDITTDRARFENVTRCYYAGARFLIWLGDSPNTNSLEGLLSVWRSRRNLANSTLFGAEVSRYTGWQLSQHIDPKSFIDIFRFMRAVTIVENGGKLAPYKEWQIIHGCRIAGVVGVPKTPFHKNLAKVGGTATILSGFGAPLASWLIDHKDWIAGLKNPWVVGTFGALGMAAGALTLLGAYMQARRNAQ